MTTNATMRREAECFINLPVKGMDNERNGHGWFSIAECTSGGCKGSSDLQIGDLLVVTMISKRGLHGIETGNKVVRGLPRT